EKRQIEGSENENQVNRRGIVNKRREDKEIGNEARVTPLVEQADDQEERARGNAVVDLLEHTAGKAVRRERKNSQGAKAKIGDRAVGDEALHVLLHEANERAINDADQGEHDDDLDDLVAQE